MRKRQKKFQAKRKSREGAIAQRTASDFAEFLLRFRVDGLSNGENARAYAIATSVMLKRAYGDEVGELFSKMTDELVLSKTICNWTLRENGAPEWFKHLCCWLREHWGIEPSIGEDEKGKFATFSTPPYWSFEERNRFDEAISRVTVSKPDE